MAGVKGRTGVGKNPNKGTKGYTNNPSGRPVGAKNKLQNSVKKQIEEFVCEDFPAFIEEIKQLDVKDRVSAKLKLLQLIIPRPANEVEEEENKNRSELIKRLFG